MNERTAWLRTRFAGILKNHGFAVVEDAPVIFDLTEAQGVLCRCAANKCGPHRCWPSCVGWGWFGMALVYIVFFLTGTYQDNRQVRGEIETAYQRMLDAAVKHEVAPIQSELSAWKEARKKEWSNILSDWTGRDISDEESTQGVEHLRRGISPDNR